MGTMVPTLGIPVVHHRPGGVPRTALGVPSVRERRPGLRAPCCQRVGASNNVTSVTLLR